MFGLTIASALGNPPLNGLWGKFHIPKSIKTVIIQSEVSRKATSKRAKMMIKNNPEMKEGMELVYTPIIRNDVRLVGEFKEQKFKDKVTQIVDVTGAQNVIFDPLISYHGGDENDNSEMRRSLDALTELQDETGITTILFHHLGKASASNDFNKIFSGRGATAIGDWAANILTLGILQKEEPEAIIEVTHHKARNFPTTPPFYLKRTQDLQFQLTAKPGGKKEQQEIIAVVEALKDLPGQQSESQKQLIDRVMANTDWSKNKSQRAIQKAIDKDQVVNTPHPTKKQVQCYTLTFNGQMTQSTNRKIKRP